jgi:dienelactone hydrolase
MNSIAADQPRQIRQLGFRSNTPLRAGVSRGPTLRLAAECPAAPSPGTYRARSLARHAPTRAARRLLGAVKLLTIGLLMGLATGAILTHPGRVAVKSLLILPELFPDAPARPLQWVSAPPRHERYDYDSPAGQVQSDLYLPAGGGPHGAIIIYTGAFGLRSEPSVARFGEALARAGAVVMIPESETLRSGDLTPGEVGNLLHALAYLRSRPEVDPRRIGILGASVGGSMALLAATDEVGREQVAFVNVMGAYYDAGLLLREAASHEIEIDGQRTSWEPDQVTRYALARQLIGPLPDGPERDILWRVVLDRQPMNPGDVEALSPEGRLILELCRRPSGERVDQILAGMPASSRERLAAISPSGNIGALKARLYMMHGVADPLIPLTQARRLAAEAPPGTLQLNTESELFKHVTPDTEAHPLVVARSLPSLLRHVWLVAQEFM